MTTPISPEVTSDFRFKPDWVALKKELTRLYQKALEPHLMMKCTPDRMAAIRSVLAEINLSVCQGAGLHAGELTIQTYPRLDPVTAVIDLQVSATGTRASDFLADRSECGLLFQTAPEPPASPVERLPWDGWPLGGPDGET